MKRKNEILYWLEVSKTYFEIFPIEYPKLLKTDGSLIQGSLKKKI